MGEAMGAMNMASLQGVDNSIASGVMAADTIGDVLEGKEDMSYGERLRRSEMVKRLRRSRSLRAMFQKGLLCGMTYAVGTGGGDDV